MDLSISALHSAYRAGSLTPRKLLERLQQEIDSSDPSIWISRVTPEQGENRLSRLDDESPETLPLYGIPFAIKDNIDLAGLPTTAACPDYAYMPDTDAEVVRRLVAAGALPIGKTNLDQFATGLVGVRSPYGVPVNPFHPDFIPGGSSSGSAVAVARNLATFSLGTDTAGSGRIPAGLNELIGLKPSIGLLSCQGVVPACRSLDCVSIFGKNVADVRSAFQVAVGFDPIDEFSRKPGTSHWFLPDSFRVGVPRSDQLEFFGNSEAATLFRSVVDRLRDIGGVVTEVDFTPFREAGLLLYEGPWVSERYAAIEEFLTRQPASLHPVTRGIIEGGGTPRAVEAFRVQYRLRQLKRRAVEILAKVDCLVTPTAGTAYTVQEVEADPVRLNSNLGYYTNFMNLLDLSACAVPAGRLPSTGLPWGITLASPAFGESSLLSLAERFLGGEPAISLPTDWVEVVVCGAHMRDLPLNHQLTDRGARFLGEAMTGDCYRLHALPSGEGIPERPGLVRTGLGEGASIAVECWAMPESEFGPFVAAIPPPLGIGKVLLDNGRFVSGFLCEEAAARKAHDITAFRGWRAYLQR